MKFTVEQIIEIIRRSNLKNPQDEEDFGYCHALADLEITFREIDLGKRTILGDWNDKDNKRPKREVSSNKSR